MSSRKSPIRHNPERMSRESVSHRGEGTIIMEGAGWGPVSPRCL